ncbi:MAG: hypothetical protein ACRDBY_12670 [Cetobacterium sp.]
MKDSKNGGLKEALKRIEDRKNKIGGKIKMSMQDWESHVLDRIDKGEELTREQRAELTWDYEVSREEIEEHRWGDMVESVIEIQGRLFSMTWFKGATENQDNEYDNDPVEVEEYEEVITIKKYRVKAK